MPKTLGLVCNLFQEVNALPGWLEMATSFFDDVQVYHAGPGGAESTDGTIEILNKWRIQIHRGKIDEGFGIVRTAAIRASPCDYVMILDADERFHQFAPVLTCDGESTSPDEVSAILREYNETVSKIRATNDKDDQLQMAEPARPYTGSADGQWIDWENVGRLGANLRVGVGDIYNQGAWLRDIIEHGALDCVAMIRRHWHDFSWKRPTQNWHTHPDYQRRLIRNHPSICFDANVRMHEQLVGASNVYQPNQTHGPFIDHYHLHFKRMEPEQRNHDVRIYDSIHWGKEVPRS